MLVVFDIPPHKRMDKDEYYPSYAEREEQKSKGWRYLSSEDLTLEQKAYVFLHSIIWAHYWRARIDIEKSKKRDFYLKLIRDEKYYPGYILDIEHYARHWLASNGDILLSPEIIKVIGDKFHLEPEECRYLPKGMSMYQFFENRPPRRKRKQKNDNSIPPALPKSSQRNK